MNITSADIPECPDWIKELHPTDVKWLDDNKTAALCVFSDSRYLVKVVCKDEATKGNRCIEVASTQDVKLEELEKVFDSFKSSEEVSPEQIAEQLRSKLTA